MFKYKTAGAIVRDVSGIRTPPPRSYIMIYNFRRNLAGLYLCLKNVSIVRGISGVPQALYKVTNCKSCIVRGIWGIPYAYIRSSLYGKVWINCKSCKRNLGPPRPYIKSVIIWQDFMSCTGMFMYKTAWTIVRDVRGIWPPPPLL